MCNSAGTTVCLEPDPLAYFLPAVNKEYVAHNLIFSRTYFSTTRSWAFVQLLLATGIPLHSVANQWYIQVAPQSCRVTPWENRTPLDM